MLSLQVQDGQPMGCESEGRVAGSGSGAGFKEQPGYFEIAGEHLYTVVHEVEAPVARVLLAGPFAMNRHHSYIPWVRWARYLAARGIEALHFDYRGVGESTGTFEKMTFSDWMNDVSSLHAWFKDRSPRVPIFLHGLSLGAIFAARAFGQGIGEGLILWSPPSDANAVLRSTLVNWNMVHRFAKPADQFKPVSHYIQKLETEGSLAVNGYIWTAELWRESFEVKLPECMTDAATASAAYGRPVKIVTLAKDAAPLLREGVPGFDEAKDFDWLFAENFNWITSTLAESRL